VRPFRLKIFLHISEIKQILIRFTCVSLFHYKISLLFFRFFSLIFTSNFSLYFYPAGRPSQLPGAGLKVSETALLTTHCCQQASFKIRSSILLHRTHPILAAFPAIIGDCKGTPSPKHKIRHTIKTQGNPVFAKAWRLDPDKLRTAEAEFHQLEVEGIIRCSDSPWLPLLHMLRKKDG
jgi:hypothetical protein